MEFTVYLSAPKIFDNAEKFVIEYPLVSIISSIALTILGIEFLNHSIVAANIVATLIAALISGACLTIGLSGAHGIITQQKLFQTMLTFDSENHTHLTRTPTQVRERQTAQGLHRGHEKGVNVLTTVKSCLAELKGRFLGISN